MQADNPIDDSGCFEDLTQEVQTLAFRTPHTCPLPYPLRKRPKPNNQKHKLELMRNHKHNTAFESHDPANFKRGVKLQSGKGKVISIGGVVFRSDFQCGNLDNVKMVAPSTYLVELDRETNSNRISAWFYFSVQGVKGETHFVIQKFSKSSSLYNHGMKVCYREAGEHHKWRRGGTRISYSPVYLDDEETNSYELHFSYFFKNTERTCIEFAYCFPYGLKKLSNLLQVSQQKARIESLGRSLNGIEMPLLTIGNNKSNRVIVVSSRVHPGQTVGSFIMQGFIRQLIGDSQYAQMLRSHFLFKIVPMLNPDGVIKGNYRFSGYGCDLNRRWVNCKEQYQPQIYHMRDLMRQLNRQMSVAMYIDLHGHSRKKDVFFYGCAPKGVENQARMFPHLMQKIHDAYRFDKCCFSVQKGKEGTARIAMWKLLQIDYVYTLEASFCGPQYGVNYLQSEYQKIGKKLCQGMALFFYEQISQTMNKSPSKLIEKMIAIKRKAEEQFKQNPQLQKMGDNQEDSGSDSEPEKGQIPESMRNKETGLPKPQSVVKKARPDKKKMAMSTKTFTGTEPIEKAEIRPEYEQTSNDYFPKANSTEKHREKNKIHPQIGISTAPKYDKLQIKIANSVNTYQFQTLRASTLYQKKVRVHSLTRNNERTDKQRRLVNPFIEEGMRQERARVNLMQGREGAQYRRVRKLAEQNMRREVGLELGAGQIVEGLPCNQLLLNQARNSSTIAPRFYPTAHKSRRNSMDIHTKKQIKKLAINGDEINVRGLGRQIFI